MATPPSNLTGKFRIPIYNMFASEEKLDIDQERGLMTFENSRVYRHRHNTSSNPCGVNSKRKRSDNTDESTEIEVRTSITFRASIPPTNTSSASAALVRGLPAMLSGADSVSRSNESLPEKRGETATKDQQEKTHLLEMQHLHLVATQRYFETQKELPAAVNQSLSLDLPLSDPVTFLDQTWENCCAKFEQLASAPLQGNLNEVNESIERLSNIKNNHPKFKCAQYMIGLCKLILACRASDIEEKKKLYKEAVRPFIAASKYKASIYWQGICHSSLAMLEVNIEAKRQHGEQATILLSRILGDRFYEVRYILGKCKLDLAEVETDRGTQQKLLKEALSHFSSIPLSYSSSTFWRGVCKYRLSIFAEKTDLKQNLLREAFAFFSKVTPACVKYQEVQYWKVLCKYWELNLEPNLEKKQALFQETLLFFFMMRPGHPQFNYLHDKIEESRKYLESLANNI